MSVYKYHAFIFLDQPPPWLSRTPTVTCLAIVQLSSDRPEYHKRTFLSPDELSLRTFCPSECVVHWTFGAYGFLFIRIFCLSGCFAPLDVLSHRPFVSGRYISGCFFSGLFFPSRRFLSGLFVWVPKENLWWTISSFFSRHICKAVCISPRRYILIRTVA